MTEQIDIIHSRHNGKLNASFYLKVVFGLTMLVYIAGLFIPIMEPDAAVYAQVSMEMHDRGDYLSIYHKGVDWLDKPHFPFWMCALSYEILGVKTFAYKLPAIFFILLAAFYTFLFGRKFYSALHGWLAVIILITAEHIIISNQDVRAEPFMTGLMIMGLYHFASVIENEKRKVWLHLLAGSLAAACLIMTKGLFSIIPLASGVGLTLIYQKKWSAIFSWKWLVAGVLIVLFLTPAIYGYYRQFDLHPEKLIFGETNISGVKFFLWTSQWGRFTNTGPIKGKGDITFFIHTLLWAFLPWAFAAFFALYRKTKQLLKGITEGENYTFFGFITLFLIFSASQFQLSFYLNPLFPLLSILTAAALVKHSYKALRIINGIHFWVCCLLVIGLLLLHYFFSADLPHWDTILVVAVGVGLAFYLFFTSHSYLKKIVFGSALVVLCVNYYLNRDFYPSLLNYQAESAAAYFMMENKIPANEVVFADEMESVADVIMHHTIKVIEVNAIDKNSVEGKFLFTNREGIARMDSLGLNYSLIKQFDDYPVTRLTGKFINKGTRHLEVKQKYLVEVAPTENRSPTFEVSRTR